MSQLYCSLNLEFFPSDVRASLRKNNNLIFGDFNLSTIIWNTDSGNPDFPESAKPQEFVTFCLESGLVQINNHPTRGLKILDMILVDDPLIINQVSDLNSGSLLESSDHASLTLLLNIPMFDNPPPKSVACLSYCDWASVNWDQYADYCNDVP